MVSDPMLDKVPDTPLVFWYPAIAGSTRAVDAGALSVTGAEDAVVVAAGAVVAGAGGAWLPPPHAASSATADIPMDTRRVEQIIASLLMMPSSTLEAAC
jgi:hypothetical protein